MPNDAQTTVRLDSSHRLAKQCSEFSIGETKKTVRDFIFLGYKITAYGDSSHEIKTLYPWKQSYDKPRQYIKKQRHHFADKGPYSQSYGFSNSLVGI